MKAISFVEAKDIIGGALNPFADLPPRLDTTLS